MTYNKVWDYFDEIICINLDHRKDRWVKVQKEFETVGVLERVKRFSAIKHQDGRIGLIKSALQIITDAKEKGLKNILIFEDDVHFLHGEKTINILEKAISQIENIDWSLFYLGANTQEKCIIFKPNLILIKNAFATHSIAFSHKIFDILIKKFQETDVINKFEDIYDVFICNEIQNKMTSFMVNPMLTIQFESYSDIEKRNVNYDFLEQRFKDNTK